LEEGWAKRLSEFYDFGLRSNIWHTFDGVSLGHLGETRANLKACTDITPGGLNKRQKSPTRKMLERLLLKPCEK